MSAWADQGRSRRHPVVGRWDAIRIDEVLTNLCSNAIKYGAGAPVEVRIGAETSRKDRVASRSSIMASGSSNAMLAKIFDPFQRASFGRARPRLGARSSYRAIHRRRPRRHRGCNE